VVHFELESTISTADFLGIRLIPLLTRIKNVAIEKPADGIMERKKCRESYLLLQVGLRNVGGRSAIPLAVTTMPASTIAISLPCFAAFSAY
jgi:hypothetical protein